MKKWKKLLKMHVQLELYYKLLNYEKMKKIIKNARPVRIIL